MKSKLPNVGTTIFTEMSRLAAEHEAINLSQGFPNFDPDPYLQERVDHHMKNGQNQYAPMAGSINLRQSISEKVRLTYDVKVDPEEEINITSGGTQAIFTAIMTFVNRDDEVIVIEPAFDCYQPAIELLGGKVVSYEMTYPDFRVDWNSFRGLISEKTRMIIINTPHNPTGSILDISDLSRLQELVSGKDIIVLSDEVYEHLIFDGQEHASILKFPKLREKSIAVYSFGKTFHCTGWKVGYAIMPANLMREFRKVHQFNVFSVNSFVQAGIADYLKDPSSYETLPTFYQKKRNLLTSYLKKSRFEVIPSKGTYFILCRYSEISDLPDIEFAKWMTREHGLACIPVSVFYQSGLNEKLVRFCFAKTEDVLHKAGEILIDV